MAAIRSPRGWFASYDMMVESAEGDSWNSNTSVRFAPPRDYIFKRSHQRLYMYQDFYRKAYELESSSTSDEEISSLPNPVQAISTQVPFVDTLCTNDSHNAEECMTCGYTSDLTDDDRESGDTELPAQEKEENKKRSSVAPPLKKRLLCRCRENLYPKKKGM